MPLPVERSQGSVSALVARFQTAADRDKEAAAAREKDSSRRVSLQPPASSSRRSSGYGYSSPSPITTPKLSLGDIDVQAPSGAAPSEVKRQGHEQGAKVGLGLGTSTSTEKGGSVEKDPQVEDISKGVRDGIKLNEEADISRPKTPDKPHKITASPSPSPARPPKSPARQISGIFMSPSNPPSPTVNTSASAAAVLPNPPAQTKSDASQSTVNPSAKVVPPSDVSKGRATATPKSSSTKPTTSGATSVKAAQSSPAASETVFPKAKASPLASSSTASVKASTAPKGNASQTQTRSRIPSGTSSTSTPRTTRPTSAATTPAGRTPNTTGASASVTGALRTPAASSRTTASASSAKALTPSLIGPARHARPSSSFSPSPSAHTPSPLKPHLTGTPSKPTASFLAKTRTPSFPSSVQGGSLSRSGGMKFSPSVRERLGSSSPSPSPPGAAGKSAAAGAGGTPTKSTISASASTSRLMQGTAASRARAAAVHPHPPTQTSASSPNRPSPNKITHGSSKANEPSKSRDSSDPQLMKGVGRSPIGRLGLAAAGMKRPAGPETEKANKVKQGRPQVLAGEAGHGVGGQGDVHQKEHDEKQASPIERPATPPPPAASVQPASPVHELEHAQRPEGVTEHRSGDDHDESHVTKSAGEGAPVAIHAADNAEGIERADIQGGSQLGALVTATPADAPTEVANGLTNKQNVESVDLEEIPDVE